MNHNNQTPSRSQQKVARLLEQLPPHAIEAEMCVLGSALIDPASLDEVVQILRGDDFYKPVNGAIFDQMVVTREANGGALDVVLLHQSLVDRDILEAIGGQDYLVELASTVPSASNAAHYARQVERKAVSRRLIELAGEMLQAGYATQEDPQSVLDTASAALMKLAERSERQPAVRIGDTFSATIDALDKTKHTKRSISTGFDDLDAVTSGLRQGEVTIIAARPSIGKSSLAMNMAMNIAQAGRAVAFFSLEMSQHDASLRVLSSHSGVSSYRMRGRHTNVDEIVRLCGSAGDLASIELYVDETVDMTAMQLRAKARLLFDKHAVQVVFVDYLQLMVSGSRSESRRVEVGQISRAMKALARELDIPVVCISQLNRDSEKREDHRPRMADLRESGDIEQDADVVLLMHREDYYHKAEPDYKMTNLAELIIAKQRHGPTGVVDLVWHGETMTFKNYSDAQLYTGGPL